jgi:phosphatidylglycerophosphate synthase
VDRFILLAPAFILVAALIAAFVVYCGLHAMGRPPQLVAVKHNQLLGPFIAGFLVWFITPIERLLIGRVSPNVITAMSLLMCLLTGIAAGIGQLAGASWLYAVAGMLDVLDGRIARLTGKQTSAGALFDSVSDRWGELFMFAGFAWHLRNDVWMLAVLGALGGSMMVSYTRARAEGLGIQLQGGMMQRAERIVLIVGGTFGSVLYGDAEATPAILGTMMLILAATSAATAINRWLIAFRVLERRAALEVVVVEPEPLPLPAVVPQRVVGTARSWPPAQAAKPSG